MNESQMTPVASDVRTPKPIRCIMPYELTTDDRGRAVAKIQLESGETVTLDQVDFERLSSAGVLCRQWFLQHVAKGSKLKYVAVRIDQHTRLVHRLILGVSDGEKTRFRSEDKLNLRRSNFAHIPRLNMRGLYAG